MLLGVLFKNMAPNNPTSKPQKISRDQIVASDINNNELEKNAGDTELSDHSVEDGPEYLDYGEEYFPGYEEYFQEDDEE